MSLKIITPPPYSMMPVLLEEAKDQARVDEDYADRNIVRLIHAVTDWLAGQNGWLGRSIMKQTLALTVPLPIVGGFTGPRLMPEAGAGWQHGSMCGIVLPRPPVIAVGKVEILDSSGAATAIAPSGFNAFDGEDGLTRLTFQPDFTWPAIASGPAHLRVTYDAGYGETPDQVDEALRHAILMTVARLYDDRGKVLNQIFRDDPMIASMFAPFRVWTA